MKKVLPFLLVISFLLTFTGCKKDSSEIDLSNLDEKTLQTQYLEKPAYQRPKSQDPMDNIFIALNVLKNASYYESESIGEVSAKKGITLATQKVKNRRIITPAAAFNESISVSSFIKVAEQLYITKDAILKREANKVSSDTNIKWKDTVDSLTNEEYLEQYGYSFKDPTRYIINEKTFINDIEIVNNGLGRKYTYKFKLEPLIASYYYKTSVKELSNSSTDPTFKSIEITMTFDYKWRMSEITTNEIYEVTISPLGKVTCYASLTETFKNIEKHTTINESSFFEKQLQK